MLTVYEIYPSTGVRGGRSDGDERGANRLRRRRDTGSRGGRRRRRRDTSDVVVAESDGAAHSARGVARGPQQPDAHHPEATRFGEEPNRCAALSLWLYL